MNRAVIFVGVLKSVDWILDRIKQAFLNLLKNKSSLYTFAIKEFDNVSHKQFKLISDKFTQMLQYTYNSPHKLLYTY